MSSHSPQNDHVTHTKPHTDADHHDTDHHDDNHEHGHGHHATKEDSEAATEVIDAFIDKAMSPVPYDIIDWKRLYDQPMSTSYDYWWNKKSMWRHIHSYCRKPLAAFLYCEESYRLTRGYPYFIGDVSENHPNHCLPEQYEASLCVTPHILKASGLMDQYEEGGDFEVEELMGLADLNLSRMKLATSTVQIPYEWREIIRHCDPKGRPGRDNVPSNEVIGCIVSLALPFEYGELSSCLKINNTTDITHKNCQLPAAAVAEGWGAIQRAREIIDDDFDNKIVPLRFKGIEDEDDEDGGYKLPPNTDMFQEVHPSEAWLQSIITKRAGCRNDFLSGPDLSQKLEFQGKLTKGAVSKRVEELKESDS